MISDQKKFVVLSKALYDSKIDITQFDLFHGVSERSGNKILGSTSSFVNKIQDGPLLVSKSGLLMPDIIMPNLSLVVTKKVKIILEEFGILFSPVVLKKLVDCWFPVSDFGITKNDIKEFLKNKNSNSNIITNLPDVPSLHFGAPEYFEVVLKKNRDLKLEHPSINTQEVFINWPIKCYFNDCFKFRYNIDLIDRFPAVWDNHLIFKKEVFEKIQNLIDFNFFVKIEVDL